MEILNLYDHPHLITQIAGWLYQEFIIDLRPGITLEHLTRSLQGRRRDQIPLAFIGMVSGECVGTVSLVAGDLKERPDLTPWLAALYVREEYRCRGYAKMLIQKVVGAAAGLGYDKLYLRTETAAGYYRDLGWRQIAETRDRFGLDTTVFEKVVSETRG